MSFYEINKSLKSIDELISEFNRIAPVEKNENSIIRSELSGLLLVAICAIYENLVKRIMIDYSEGVNIDFSNFIEKNFEKINSKISIDDLKKYLELFGNDKKIKFNIEINRIKERLGGEHPNEKFSQLLRWRHSYAHSKNHNNTTIEEVVIHHKYSRLIIYAFYKSINQ